MQTKPLIIILIFMISCSNQWASSNRSAIENIQNVLNEMVLDNDTPGLQYIICNRDSILFEYNQGLSDIINKTTVTSHTTFNAFSVTKTFTALAIMQLKERGLLNIDDKAQKYLNNLPYKSTFTIRQLLNHTAGLPNPLPLNWIHIYSEADSFNYNIFFKKVIHENNELDSAPGTKYAYSNIGYMILGEIITQISGMEYRTYIKKNIIDKLLFKDGAYLGFNIPDTSHHACGYIKKWSFLNFGLNFLFDKDKYILGSYNGWSQFKYFYINGYPHGGLIGNATGFASYLQSLLKDEILLNNPLKQVMFATQRRKDGTAIDYCLGWFKGKLLNEVYFAHSGGGGAYYSEIRLYPEREMASVIMLNRTGVSDERILDNIDIFYLKNP